METIIMRFIGTAIRTSIPPPKKPSKCEPLANSLARCIQVLCVLITIAVLVRLSALGGSWSYGLKLAFGIFEYSLIGFNSFIRTLIIYLVHLNIPSLVSTVS